ncbi:MAG: RagB/SusD family nutrient uptake outer membrane protein [Balneolales bacterium]
MNTRLINIIALFAVVINVLGCASDWLDEDPPHILTVETVYSDLEGFEAGLNGLYAEVRREHEGVDHSVNLIKDMFINGTDNVVVNQRGQVPAAGSSLLFESWGDLNDPGYLQFEVVFSWLYRIINQANTIIGQAETSSDVEWAGGGASADENKIRVIAEARAVRAWAYRHLTYGWGDVPLNLEESRGTTIRTDWERNPVEQVREQVISDFLFAEEVVPIEPVPGRISKGAIQHYLAEMYLVLDKPDSTLYWADQAINTPEYQLVTERYGVNSSEPGVPYSDMFYDGNANREEGNTEALWVFQFARNVTGGGTHAIMRRTHMTAYDVHQVDGVTPLKLTYDRGGRGQPRMSLTKFAIDAYEPQDDRASEFAMRKFFILNDADGNSPQEADELPPGYEYGDTLWLDWSEDLTYDTRRRTDWPYLRKFEGTDPNDVSSNWQWNDQVYLRLADTYLLKAEAQFRLGLPGDAAKTINIIRRRSNTSDISADDVDIDFILDERSRELALEEHRRWTLLRTNKWLERTQKYNHNGGNLISERDVIFPIPRSVIDANLTGDMHQNSGF